MAAHNKSSYNDPVADAATLYKSMKGLGTDDNTLIGVITTRSRRHLQAVKAVYPQNHKNTLEKDIKGDTSGHYEDILLAMITDRNDYLASLVSQSVKGLGTNEDLLVQVICTNSADKWRKIAQSFRNLYGKDMAKEILDDLSGDTAALFRALLEGRKPNDSNVDLQLAKSDAKRLFDAGEGKWGTDEKVFIEILATRSRAQTEAMGRAYADVSGHSIGKAIEKETSGTFSKALYALVTPRDEFFALAFRRAMEGLGTHDDQLIRLVAGLSRSQIRAADVWYTQRFGNSLAKDIGSETSGNFKKVLLAVLPSQGH